MTAIAVFAYGSLVDQQSAAMTLGREVEAIPARLGGWRRRWSQVRDNLAVEKTFAIGSSGALPTRILGLNIEPAPGVTAAAGPNGTLIEVTEADLAALDRRELRYDRVEVEVAEQGSRFATVFSYTAKPANHASRPPAGAVIVAAYARTVERGFAAIGAAELATYLETTGPPPAEVVEARLVVGAIPVGNPRQW
jgi:cation transport regulator ChaC